MLRGLRMLAAMLALMLLFGCSGETLPGAGFAFIPDGGVVQGRTEENGMAYYTVLMPETGEEIRIACDAQGAVVSVQTQRDADFDSLATTVEKERAQQLVQAAYPDCRILFSQTVDSTRQVGIAEDDFCGVIVVADDQICSRSLQMGEIYQNGMLTREGAKRVLALHRPQAQLLEIELDEDDGVYVYEGEALVDGAEYEFELSASSGKLLEWEWD